MHGLAKGMLALAWAAVFCAFAHGELWEVEGETFDVKKVLSVSDSRVTVQHAKGISQFKLASLSPELQQKFGFDSNRAEREDDVYEQKRLATAMAEERRVHQQKQKVFQDARAKELEKQRQIQRQSRSAAFPSRGPLKSRFDVNKVIKEIGDKTELQVEDIIGKPDSVKDYNDGMMRRYRYDNAVLDKKDKRLYPFYVYFEKKQFGVFKATSWRRWGIGRRLPLDTDRVYR